jgi:hypothetical protein
MSAELIVISGIRDQEAKVRQRFHKNHLVENRVSDLFMMCDAAASHSGKNIFEQFSGLRFLISDC